MYRCHLELVALKRKKIMSERTTHAKKGERLYSIAKRTVPAGKSVDSWFNAIRKMNTKNGKIRKVSVNTGVALPPGARNASAADRAGMPGPNYMGPNPTRTPKKTNGNGR